MGYLFIVYANNNDMCVINISNTDTYSLDLLNCKLRNTKYPCFHLSMIKLYIIITFMWYTIFQFDLFHRNMIFLSHVKFCYQMKQIPKS